MAVVSELTRDKDDVRNKLSIATNDISLAKQKLVVTVKSCSI